jgi:hypothetical protein
MIPSTRREHEIRVGANAPTSGPFRVGGGLPNRRDRRQRYSMPFLSDAQLAIELRVPLDAGVDVHQPFDGMRLQQREKSFDRRVGGRS